jgi:hypothetical protein
MATYTFEREMRTAESETFSISADNAEVGRVDIHFGLDVVHATLCVPDTYSEDDIQDLIGDIDERLVMTAHPYREDFIVTVWMGRRAGVYSEDTDEEFEEEIEGNGHRE